MHVHINVCMHVCKHQHVFEGITTHNICTNAHMYANKKANDCLEHAFALAMLWAARNSRNQSAAIMLRSTSSCVICVYMYVCMYVCMYFAVQYTWVEVCMLRSMHVGIMYVHARTCARIRKMRIHTYERCVSHACMNTAIKENPSVRTCVLKRQSKLE